MTPPPTATAQADVVGCRQKKAHGGEHRRASTVCAKALEETPPRTALWDARPAPPPTLPPPPTTPATPVRHPDESEDDFRARLETVRQLRDRLETDDRMDLACECAKRGVAFDGDDSAAMLRRRLAQDQLPRTYASASARKQSRAARRKAQRKANRALGRLSSGPLMDEIRAPSCPSCRAPRRRRRRRARCGQPRDRRAARSPPRAPPPATPLKRGTSLDALDAAWPAWGQEPELAGDSCEAPPTRSRPLKPLAPEPRPSTRNKRGRPT